jgi:hypothetical protein
MVRNPGLNEISCLAFKERYLRPEFRSIIEKPVIEVQNIYLITAVNLPVNLYTAG